MVGVSVAPMAVSASMRRSVRRQRKPLNDEEVKFLSQRAKGLDS